MAEKPLGTTESVELAARGFAKFAKDMARAAETIRRVVAQLEQQREEQHRAEWWKRGECEPEFVCDKADPEWWQRGDDPPPFGCAA